MTKQPYKADFQHDVFISYSRKDAAFARKLEKALEAYRPPKKIGLTRRNLRVFRDESDMTGVEYYQSIDNYLRQASKLLVICSPEAATSQYVNDEIKRFASSHSKTDVIPILLGGLPNNEAGPDDQDQCAFPSALVEIMQMPLAIGYTGFGAARDRIGKGRFENAWYSLLANIYNLSRDEIEQRERKRIARRRFIVSSLALLLISVLSIALIVTILARNEAERRRILAESGQLANQALLTMRTDSTRALLQATESVRKAATANSLTVLRQAIQSAKCEIVLPHGASVHVVAYHHPSGQIVTGGEDRKVKFWDSGSGQLIRQLDTGPLGVGIVKFTEAGNLFAVTTRRSIRLYDSNSLVELRHFDSRNAGFMSIDFSPDGKLLVAAAGASWHVWDVESGEKIGTAGGTIINRAAFNKNSDMVVASYRDGHNAVVWDLKSEKKATSIYLGGPVAKALFDPSGEWVATMGRNANAGINRLNPNEKRLRIDVLHRGKVNDIAFNIDGQLATAGEDGTVRIWKLSGNLPTKDIWQDIFVGTEHDGPVEHAIFNPSGDRLASVGQSGVVRVWQRLKKGGGFVQEQWEALTRFSVPFKSVSSAAFSQNGLQLSVAGGEGQVMVFRITADSELFSLTPTIRTLTDIEFNPSGNRLLTRGRFQVPRLWNGANGLLIARLGEADYLGNEYDFFRNVSFDPYQNRILAIAPSYRFVSWDANSGKRIDALDIPRKNPSLPPSVEIISPDGRFAVISDISDKPDELWDMATNSQLRSIEKNAKIQFLGLRSQWLLVINGDTTVKVTDTVSGMTVSELATVEKKVERFTSILEGKSLMGGDQDNNIHVWDILKGDLLRTIKSQSLISQKINSIRIFKCGKVVFNCGSGVIKILQDYRNESVTEIDIGPDELREMEMSPDGFFLLTKDEAGRVKLWHTADGSLQSTIPELGGSLKFSADGKQFAVLKSRHAKLYLTETDALLELADSRIPLELY